MTDKCSGRQVTKLTSNVNRMTIKEYDRQVTKPTSNLADEYPSQRIPIHTKIKANE